MTDRALHHAFRVCPKAMAQHCEEAGKHGVVPFTMLLRWWMDYGMLVGESTEEWCRRFKSGFARSGPTADQYRLVLDRFYKGLVMQSLPSWGDAPVEDRPDVDSPERLLHRLAESGGAARIPAAAENYLYQFGRYPLAAFRELIVIDRYVQRGANLRAFDGLVRTWRRHVPNGPVTVYTSTGSAETGALQPIPPGVDCYVLDHQQFGNIAHGRFLVLVCGPPSSPHGWAVFMGAGAGALIGEAAADAIGAVPFASVFELAKALNRACSPAFLASAA